MSEEENFKSIVLEIKDILLFLIDQEPTPDDEIDAKDNLIKKFKNLKELNPSPDQNKLIEDILTELEGWDTLDLWFKEVEGLSENIKNLINLCERAEQIRDSESITKEKVEIPAKIEEKKQDPQIDITEIVAQVSEQFKEEIGSLKEKIDLLKNELDLKEIEIKEFSPKKTVQKIVPKKVSKLKPPKIKIPLIKKPEKAPKIKVPIEHKVKEIKEGTEIKEEKIKLIDIKEKVIEPRISKEPVEEPIISLEPKEKPSIPLETPQKPDIITKPNKKPKMTLTITEEPSNISTSEIPFETPLKSILEKIPDYKEVILTPLPKEKPKLTPVPKEKLELSLLPEDKPEQIKTTEDDLKLTPLLAEKPEIMQKTGEKLGLTPLPADKPKLTSEVIEKPDLTPIISKKPKISPISVEEVDTESIKPSSTELFNVFSSMGDKKSEQLMEIFESSEKISEKGKKKKGEKKKKPEESIKEQEIRASYKPIITGPISNMDALPTDKDSLYQELIALEGRRYSLEKSYKDLSKNYGNGSFNEYEFNHQGEELKKNLDEISSRITKIRGIISNL